MSGYWHKLLAKKTLNVQAEVFTYLKSMEKEISK